jgi:hypothetical protein
MRPPAQAQLLTTTHLLLEFGPAAGLAQQHQQAQQQAQPGAPPPPQQQAQFYCVYDMQVRIE